MERFLKHLLFLALCATPAAGQERKSGQAFGDWTIRCAGGGSEDCTLTSAVIRDSDKIRVLEAQIAKTLDAGPVMIISTPWGIRLPHGLAVQIDQNKPKRYAFEFCDPSGCHLGIPMDTANLPAFKKGLKAVMQFLDRDGKPVTVELSLIGFTKGYEAL